jgi:hypothetical protein
MFALCVEKMNCRRRFSERIFGTSHPRDQVLAELFGLLSAGAPNITNLDTVLQSDHCSEMPVENRSAARSPLAPGAFRRAPKCLAGSWNNRHDGLCELRGRDGGVVLGNGSGEREYSAALHKLAAAP